MIFSSMTIEFYEGLVPRMIVGMRCGCIWCWCVARVVLDRAVLPILQHLLDGLLQAALAVEHELCGGNDLLSFVQT